jgi:hypothetical protein
VVNETVAAKQATQTPIGFSVQRQNVTRSATNLETLKHYNFGVWAYKKGAKTGISPDEALVMQHYLVGYSNGADKGYDKAAATTWATTTGTVIDHTSPWFYEGLGTAQYTNPSSGFYQTSQTDYMSANTNQYLRYWDLAYTNTNFYCYAPYNKSVTFTESSKTITIPKSLLTDGYDEPLTGTAMNHNLRDFMYAGKQATNANKEDVTLQFKRIGSQVFIRFYEDIPGYKVEIINLGDDVSPAATPLADNMKAIQATPAAKSGTSYSEGTYYKAYAADITFDENMNPTCSPSTTDREKGGNLIFQVPMSTLPSGSVVESGKHAMGSVTIGSTSHATIAEAVSTGSDQKYSYSPTVYYPLPQVTSSTTGFTFHVSYRIIAEDNNEIITVHDARVHVPANDGASTPTYIAAWQPNTKYTYTFKITKDSNGTTDPSQTIDPSGTDPGSKKALYPIVFDGATLEDYTPLEKEYNISDGTSY